MDSSSLLQELRNTVSCKITDEESVLNTYGTDWTREFIPDPLAIVFPESINNIRDIVIFANKHKVPLVPSGGRTGLSAGAVASHRELVISLDKMNKIIEFNETDRLLSVEAGVTTQEIQEFAKENNLFYPIDLSSKGSSQIGGNIATNAGGIHVIRYGLTKNWIKGLRVVTGNANVLDLNKGLTKNATGYNLKDLFIGSEGTLGIICEAIVELTDKPRDSVNILLSVSDISKSSEILNLFRNNFILNAFEFFSNSAVKHINTISKIKFPLKNSPYYLLIDIECGSEEQLIKAESIYNVLSTSGIIVEGIISQNNKQYNELWSFRENITEAISVFLTYKNDISVKPSQIPLFIKDIQNIINNEYPEFDTILFGHIGDGNIHISILKPKSYDKGDFLKFCKEVNHHLYRIVAKFEGSISAEHGVGMIKRPYLMYTRTAKEIEIMKNIKSVFDVNNIMNPGKIFPS